MVKLRAIDAFLPCRHNWRLHMVAFHRVTMECGHCGDTAEFNRASASTVLPVCGLVVEGEAGAEPTHDWRSVFRAGAPGGQWDVLRCHWCGSYSVRLAVIDYQAKVDHVMRDLATGHRLAYQRGDWWSYL